MQEKRSSPRVIVGLPAFLDSGKFGDHFVKVHVIDLSVEGVSVCSPLVPNQGAHCRLVMNIPGEGDRKIRATCELVYSVLSNLDCEFRLGLRFVELQNDDRAVLQEYLDWRLAAGLKPSTAGGTGPAP